jgi:STE24 endopeptidase
MHLFTIFAFALVFWRAEAAGPWRIIPTPGARLTLLAALGPPILLGLAACVVAGRACRMAQTHADGEQRAHTFHHRVTVALRLALAATFGFTMLATPWPEWFAFAKSGAALQIVADVVVLAPFFAGAVALWIGAYPYESMVRRYAIGAASPGAADVRWNLATHLDFNIRHHLLVIAIPMTVILFTANLTHAYEDRLMASLGSPLAPDVVLGAAAALVFVIAPLMLRRIWRTTPLPAGPLRDRLEALCRRIDLRCREILVWKSDGYMINAAVMGVFAPVRYVLLSDALLATMTPGQVEAVFGHEAGHVRHHHIPHFLGFAFVGWLGVVGLMELLARNATAASAGVGNAVWTVEGAGVAATAVFWGIGFGWVSRRFERQADLFGARCASPPDGRCEFPCSVHLADEPPGPSDDRRVCATGATVFASALDRVALLNGIPREERSWRHSSIGNRVRFLISAAGDPNRAVAFERSVRRVKLAIWAVAVVGAACTIWYWFSVSQPALMRLQAGVG